MALYEGKLSPAYSVLLEPDSVRIEGRNVPIDQTEKLFSQYMQFTWEGHQFALMKYEDGIVTGSIVGIDPLWAHEHGLHGDQYSGWSGQFPEEEIEDVLIKRHDLLAEWRHEKEKGTRPPLGLYTTYRSAKSE